MPALQEKYVARKRRFDENSAFARQEATAPEWNLPFTKEDRAMLDYDVRRHTLYVRLQNDLDHRAAQQLRAEVDALLGDMSIRRLVLDLKHLRFMDSSGIGFIIGRCRLMQRRGGSVAVAHADARMNRIFEMAGLYQLVERLA